MTQAIEDALNLPRLEDALRELGSNPDDIEAASAEVEAMASALERMSPTMMSHNDVDGVETHVAEADDVIMHAMKAHKQLMDLGFNIEAKHAGSIFNPAGKFLEIALKASSSKVEKKLALLKHRLEQERQDFEMKKNVTEGTIESDQPAQGQLMDRNELMKLMKQAKEAK